MTSIPSACLRPSMLIIALCLALGAVCALLVTAAASQLRQRNVAPLEVEVGRGRRYTTDLHRAHIHETMMSSSLPPPGPSRIAVCTPRSAAGASPALIVCTAFSCNL